MRNRDYDERGGRVRDRDPRERFERGDEGPRGRFEEDEWRRREDEERRYGPPGRSDPYYEDDRERAWREEERERRDYEEWRRDRDWHKEETGWRGYGRDRDERDAYEARDRFVSSERAHRGDYRPPDAYEPDYYYERGRDRYVSRDGRDVRYDPPRRSRR